MSAFAKKINSEPDPRETIISAILWEWVFSPPCARDELSTPASKLSDAVEFWLCGVFHQVEFTRSRGIWCDGVIELLIQQLHRRAFLLKGVGWFPDWLAPFEIEMHYPRRRATQPVRTVLRFGERNRRGEIRKNAKPKYTEMMIANRPKLDGDWAVAVELTQM